MAERVAQIGESLIVYDDSLVSQISEALFDPRHWDDRDLVPGQSGRGASWFVRHEGQEWVLRHYYRGGAARHFVDDRYVWAGADRTRPFREWRLLSRFRQLSLPAPVPVAALCRRQGISYTGDLITGRLPGVVSLSHRLEHDALTADTWTAVGRCIARFHAAGAFHADLNAHNIQIDDRGRIYLLDFDRGRILRSGGRWQQRNIARLLRSLTKIGNETAIAFGPSEWKALIEGYEAESGAAG